MRVSGRGKYRRVDLDEQIKYRLKAITAKTISSIEYATKTEERTNGL
jgi:hypothetical protein